MILRLFLTSLLLTTGSLAFAQSAPTGIAQQTPAPAAQQTPPVRDAAWRKAQADYLIKIDKQRGWSKTACGLRYRQIGAARTKASRPASGSDVSALYKVALIDGTVLDQSEAGKPTPLPLNKTVPGFRAGVEMMRVGETYELVVPHYLGYGAKGGGPVPGYATLIFTIELTHVEMPEA